MDKNHTLIEMRQRLF